MAKSLEELKAERGTRKRAVTLAINAAKQALVELASNDKLTESRKKLVEAFRELETVQAAVIASAAEQDPPVEGLELAKLEDHFIEEQDKYIPVLDRLNDALGLNIGIAYGNSGAVAPAGAVAPSTSGNLDTMIDSINRPKLELRSHR